MSKTRFAFLFSVLVVAQWVCKCPCSAQPENYGFPPKLTDLTWLTPFHKVELTPYEKTEILVTWLIREIQEPSPTRRGLGGGDITSGYTQIQILTALFVEGDPLAISEIASDKSAGDDVRDGMHIALGLMGDSAQIPILIDILENHHELYFRAKAAEALGLLGATEAIPALQKALEDEGSVTSGNSMEGVYTGYPVRRLAKTALKKLENPEKVNAAKERNRAFTKRFENLQHSMVSLQDSLAKIGWTITWDTSTRKAVITANGVSATILVETNAIVVAGQEVKMRSPVELVNEQLYVKGDTLSQIMVLLWRTSLNVKTPNTDAQKPAAQLQQAKQNVRIKAPLEVRLDKTKSFPIVIEATNADGEPFSGQVKLWAYSAGVKFDVSNNIMPSPASAEIKDGKLMATVLLERNDISSPLTISVIAEKDNIIEKASIEIRYPGSITVLTQNLSVPADGTSKPIISAIIKDQFREPLEDVEVTARFNSFGTEISICGNTDAKGIVNIALDASNKAGRVLGQMIAGRLASQMITITYTKK